MSVEKPGNIAAGSSFVGDLVRFNKTAEQVLKVKVKGKDVGSTVKMMCETFKDHYIPGETVRGFVAITSHIITALQEIYLQVVGYDHKGQVMYRSDIATFEARQPDNVLTPGEYMMAVGYQLESGLKPNVLGKKKEKLSYALVITLLHADKRTSSCETSFTVAPDPGPVEDAYLNQRMHIYATTDKLAYGPGSIVRIKCQIPHFPDEKAEKMKAVLLERCYTKNKAGDKWVRSERFITTSDKFWNIEKPKKKLFNRPSEKETNPADKIGLYGSTLQVPMRVQRRSTTFDRIRDSSGPLEVTYHTVRVYLPGNKLRTALGLKPLVEAVVPVFLDTEPIDPAHNFLAQLEAQMRAAEEAKEA